MARILLAWEFGQGFGHLQRLLPIALELRTRGHDCFLVVREATSSHAVLAPHRLPFLTLPRLTRAAEHTTRQDRPLDLIVDAEFSHLQRLRLRLAVWDNILSVTKPDVLVADTSPTACLAARGTDIRCLIVGNGTFIPPGDGSDIALPPEILAPVNQVQSERSRPGVQTFADILSARSMFVTTIPELDPSNSGRSEENRCGPMKPLPPPTDRQPTTDYFAYLANPSNIDIILDGLVLSRLRGSVFIRDMPLEKLRVFQARGLTIHASPRNLPDELAAAALLIHHSGPGTMEVGMAIGRPQLLFPNHHEQAFYTLAAVRLGVAQALSRRTPLTAERVAAAARSLVANKQASETARKLALALEARGPFHGALKVADAVEAVLAR